MHTVHPPHPLAHYSNLAASYITAKSAEKRVQHLYSFVLAKPTTSTNPPLYYNARGINAEEGFRYYLAFDNTARRLVNLLPRLCSQHCRTVMDAAVQLAFLHGSYEGATVREYYLDTIPPCVCRTCTTDDLQHQSVPLLLNTNLSATARCDVKLVSNAAKKPRFCANDSDVLAIQMANHSSLQWLCRGCFGRAVNHQTCCGVFYDAHTETGESATPYWSTCHLGHRYHTSHKLCPHGPCSLGNKLPKVPCGPGIPPFANEDTDYEMTGTGDSATDAASNVTIDDSEATPFSELMSAIESTSPTLNPNPFVVLSPPWNKFHRELGIVQLTRQHQTSSSFVPFLHTLLMQLFPSDQISQEDVRELCQSIDQDGLLLTTLHSLVCLCNTCRLMALSTFTFGLTRLFSSPDNGVLMTPLSLPHLDMDLQCRCATSFPLHNEQYSFFSAQSFNDSYIGSCSVTATGVRCGMSTSRHGIFFYDYQRRRAYLSQFCSTHLSALSSHQKCVCQGLQWDQPAFRYLKVAAITTSSFSLLVGLAYLFLRCGIFNRCCRQRRDPIYARPSDRRRRRRHPSTPSPTRVTYIASPPMVQNPLFSGADNPSAPPLSPTLVSTTSNSTQPTQPTSSQRYDSPSDSEFTPDSLDDETKGPLGFTDKALARPKMKMARTRVNLSPTNPEDAQFRLQVVWAPSNSLPPVQTTRM